MRRASDPGALGAGKETQETGPHTVADRLPDTAADGVDTASKECKARRLRSCSKRRSSYKGRAQSSTAMGGHKAEQDPPLDVLVLPTMESMVQDYAPLEDQSAPGAICSTQRRNSQVRRLRRTSKKLGPSTSNSVCQDRDIVAEILNFPRSSPTCTTFDIDALNADLTKAAKPRRRASSCAAGGRGRRSMLKQSARKTDSSSDLAAPSTTSLPSTVEGDWEAPSKKEKVIQL
jgi:hypothetical protein